MGSCWRSAPAMATAESTSGTSAAAQLASVLRGHTSQIVAGPVRALGLLAGDLELGWHDPALGRSLGGAPGDGTG